MISFALTEDQNIARAAAADFASRWARPAARAADESGRTSDLPLDRAWALGLVQTAAGEERSEQPTALNAIVLEEIAAGDAALALALAAPLGFVKAIAESGSADQRQVYLPRFQDDAPRFAAIAHRDAGWFRGAGRATRATRAKGGWRIDGAKALVPFPDRCELFLVTAETDEGRAAFVVEASTPGVQAEAAKGTLGLRALQMAGCRFQRRHRPRGGQTSGKPRRIVDMSRVALAAILGGLARAVYEYALPYTKERVVHGEAIARKQAVAFKLADMHVAIQAMRWMTLRAACELDVAPSAARSASLARRYAAEHGMKVADEGVQLFGGHGYIRDMPLEMWCRNARTLSVFDGLVGA